MPLTRTPQFISLGVLGMLLWPSTKGAPACPRPFNITLADGNISQVYLKGDEEYHYLIDLHGNAILNSTRGYQLGLGGISNYHSSSRRQKQDSIIPEALSDVRPVEGGFRLLGQGSAFSARSFSSRPGPSKRALATQVTEGTVNNLVIPIRWADHHSRPLPSQGELEDLFNSPGGPAAWAEYANMSVRDYLRSNSFGRFELDSTVVPWFNSSYSEADVTLEATSGLSGAGYDNFQAALLEALAHVDQALNFSLFDGDNDGYMDGVGFLHSGYAAEWGDADASGTDYTRRLWSHKGELGAPYAGGGGVRVEDYHSSSALYGASGAAVTTIAVAAHEALHYFGLPDLYDPDYDAGAKNASAGLGRWCVMSDLYGWDGTARLPPNLGAWGKYQLGWVAPQPLSRAGGAAQVLALGASAFSDAVYLVAENFPAGEYLLIENRQPVGLERRMPQGGLLLTHADDALALAAAAPNANEGHPGQPRWPGNGRHYGVAVVQADGAFDLERNANHGDAGDVFHGGGTSHLSHAWAGGLNTWSYQGRAPYPTNVSLGDISYAMGTMTFRVCFDSVDPVCTAGGSSAFAWQWLFLLLLVLPVGAAAFCCCRAGKQRKAAAWKRGQEVVEDAETKSELSFIMLPQPRSAQRPKGPVQSIMVGYEEETKSSGGSFVISSCDVESLGSLKSFSPNKTGTTGTPLSPTPGTHNSSLPSVVHWRKKDQWPSKKTSAAGAGPAHCTSNGAQLQQPGASDSSGTPGPRPQPAQRPSLSLHPSLSHRPPPSSTRHRRSPSSVASQPPRPASTKTHRLLRAGGGGTSAAAAADASLFSAADPSVFFEAPDVSASIARLQYWRRRSLRSGVSLLDPPPTLDKRPALLGAMGGAASPRRRASAPPRPSPGTAAGGALPETPVPPFPLPAARPSLVSSCSSSPRQPPPGPAGFRAPELSVAEPGDAGLCVADQRVCNARDGFAPPDTSLAGGSASPPRGAGGGGGGDEGGAGGPRGSSGRSGAAGASEATAAALPAPMPALQRREAAGRPRIKKGARPERRPHI